MYKLDSKFAYVEVSSNINKPDEDFNAVVAKRKLSGSPTINEITLKKSRFYSNKQSHIEKYTGRNTILKYVDPTLHCHIELQKKRLPVYACKDRITEEVLRSDTLLIMGETGSGKTTQIPQFLLKAGCSKAGLIGVTQPRRVAAVTVAKRVALECGCKLGELVGYSVRFEDCTSSLTRIKFMTDGMLLREALSDRLLKKYSVLMLDEAHERTINNDVIFGIAKEAQRYRNIENMEPLKLVVTSATMDIDHFSTYFGVRGMYLEGKTYPVKVMHTKMPHIDYLHAVIVTLFEIHRTADMNHDVLVFLTGQEEIESMAQQVRLIAKTNSIGAPTLRVFPLYAQLPQHKQLECFLPTTSNCRKVILATNIAETSITIPGIRYIVDCGFVKQRVYNSESNLDILKIVRISQAQSWQRCGRAGRDAEGICFRTYTKSEMDCFETMTKPEILRSNISATVLQLLFLDIDCNSFDFIDKPSSEALDAAFKNLQSLGAIKNINRPELTSLGRQMAQFPLDPKYSKLILTAPSFGCIAEILSLVAILSADNVFVSNTEKKELAALAHAKFGSKYGDHLTLLNVFNSFQKAERVKVWCHDNFLNYKNLLYTLEVRNQLQEITDRLGLQVISCGKNIDLVRKCLLYGLSTNIAKLHRENFYMTINGRQRAKIHPTSVLYSKYQPEYILFSEIVLSERNFFRLLTEIDSNWISEIFPKDKLLNEIKRPLD